MAWEVGAALSSLQGRLGSNGVAAVYGAGDGRLLSMGEGRGDEAIREDLQNSHQVLMVMNSSSFSLSRPLPGPEGTILQMRQIPPADSVRGEGCRLLARRRRFTRGNHPAGGFRETWSSLEKAQECRACVGVTPGTWFCAGGEEPDRTGVESRGELDAWGSGGELPPHSALGRADPTGRARCVIRLERQRCPAGGECPPRAPRPGYHACEPAFCPLPPAWTQREAPAVVVRPVPLNQAAQA